MGEPPVGYFAHFDHRPATPDDELETTRWTVQAAEVLDPDAFLLTVLSAPALLHPSFDELVEQCPAGSFLPVLEWGRVGRRRAEMTAALTNLRRLGLPVAITGHRISSAGGGDVLVVSPNSAGALLQPADRPLVVTDVRSDADLLWAKEMEADLLEGPAVAEPIKVAPVDLHRLRRR